MTGMIIDFMVIEGAKIYQLNVVKHPFLLLFNKIILFFSALFNFMNFLYIFFTYYRHLNWISNHIHLF
jgi:hypothetical protein